MKDSAVSAARAGRAGDLPAPYGAMLRAYAAALAGSRLADSSRAVYLRRVRGYLAWIAATATDERLPDERLPGERLADGRSLGGCSAGVPPVRGPLGDMTAAVHTARAYHRWLDGRRAPRTTAGILAAVEDFHARLRLGATGIPRARARDPQDRPEVPRAGDLGPYPCP
ncbi:hypothetical protein [Nonomuraea sp. GTA35]|uniref:hypothetical protein n=1 Tax=Nonomuraea sp. GTA35 TaxID=1676746 RepID=UPI0035C23B89